MEDKERIIKRISYLLRKEFLGELTSDERIELEDWLRADESNRVWYEERKTSGFIKINNGYYSEITEPERAWERLEMSIERKERRYRLAWMGSVAAVFVIVFSTMFLFNKEEVGRGMMLTTGERHSPLISLIVDRGRDSIRLDVDENIGLEKSGVRAEHNTLIYDTLPPIVDTMEYHTLAVGMGGEYRLTLSDGTVVWLNSASALRYPVHFTGNEREVELWGEAYFDVRQDKKRPFRVKSGNFNVEVLGTSFDIMNYSDERFAQITLATGKLRVNKGDDQVIMQPNQQVQIDGDRLDLREVDARYYTSWIDNKFMFDDETLDVIVRKLARWYNLGYEFRDTTLMKTRFSGQLLKYKDITKAFDLLELTTDVEFSINQDKIMIMRKKP